MATLGKTSIGGTTSSLSQNFQWAAGPYTATENGTITEIAWYVHSTSTSLKLGVFEDDGGVPGALIAVTGTIAGGTGWRSGAASGSLSNGQSYWIGMICNNSHSSVYDVGSKGIRYVATSFATGLTDPYPGGSTLVSSQDYSGYCTYTPGPALAITAPAAWKLYQRNGSNVASIPISGTISGITGDLEARFNGGSWATIATISGDGAWSGTLTGQSPGRGTVEVRMVLSTSITASVQNIGVGDLYLVCGDSISEGQLTNAQNHDLASNKPSAYRQNDTWVEANDPVDTGTLNGSQWPLLSRLLTTATGVPVAFVTTATGSTDLAGSNSSLTYYAKPNTGWGILTSQAAEAGTSYKALLLHFGPNAGTSSPALTQAEYAAAIATFAANVRADIQASIPIYMGVYGRSVVTTAANPTLRRAISQAVREGSISAGPSLLGPNFSDGVHPKSDSDAAIVAGRWYAALTGTGSPKISAAGLNSSTELDVEFDQDLGGTNGDTYTVSLFSANSLTPISATRTAIRRIRLVFASSLAEGQTLTYVPGEQHINATMPSSVSVALPISVHSVSAASQPADPWQITISGSGIGLGARTVTITVTDGTDPISGVNVRMTAGEITHIKQTNGSGVATFNVDDATWTVAITKTGYTFGGASLVVDGNETQTYAMSEISVEPEELDVITCYYLCLDNEGQPESDVDVTLQAFAPLTGSGRQAGIALNNAARLVVSDGDGIASFDGVPTGFRYRVSRGDTGARLIAIRPGADNPLALHSIVGN
jgi:hypothetical protein